MIEFLKEGKKLNNVSMGMNIDNIYSILGEPDEVIGNENGGYIHYNEFRYGYDSSQIVTEMSIEFVRMEKNYMFKNLKNKKYGMVLHESFKIGSNTKIHKFIRFLNHLQLNWEANSSYDKDYLTIKLKPGPYILFDLQDGTPYKISIVDGYQ